MPERVELSTDKVIAATDNGVGWIVLNNPDKHNAISRPMFDGMGQAVAHFDADQSVRAIVVRGAGDKAFAAGADLNDLPVDGYPEGLRRLTATNKPTIAMIHGWCLGGGVMTAMCTDIRFAATDAVFSIPAARLGVGYPLAGVMRLHEVAGASTASDLLLTGDRMSAERAYTVGLVQRLSSADDLHRNVLDLATAMAGNAPLSAVASKTSIRAAVGTGTDSAAIAAIDAAWNSEDMIEGQGGFR